MNYNWLIIRIVFWGNGVEIVYSSSPRDESRGEEKRVCLLKGKSIFWPGKAKMSGFVVCVLWMMPLDDFKIDGNSMVLRPVFEL